MPPRVGASLAAPDLDVPEVKDGRSKQRPYKGIILPADEVDWRAFMAMAGHEGWRVPEHELALHRQGGCSQSWALRQDGATIGLVTGVLHHRSAWIGNLIIAEAERGRGYGVALFEHVVKALRAAGATTLWLTASAAGAPLYGARGFQSVGQVDRWVRKIGGSGDGTLPSTDVQGTAVDSIVWGDERSRLLHHLEKSGKWQQQGESLALLQRSGDLQIIGPWYGSSQRQDDAELLKRLIAAAAPQVELVVDLLGDCGREEFLAAAGFTRAGSTSLMVAGPMQVQWSRLLALATLGSCG